MREQVVYYDDPLRDDFADNHISTQTVGAEFDYVPQGILYNTFGTLLYYLIAIPVVWLLAKICLGLRMKNRKALRKVRGGPFYLYGNHTQNLDAVIPAIAAFPQRAYVIAHRDAVSIPGLRTIVQMLGLFRCHPACPAWSPLPRLWSSGRKREPALGSIRRPMCGPIIRESDPLRRPPSGIRPGPGGPWWLWPPPTGPGGSCSGSCGLP